jgi:hypothetical protein
MLRDDYTALNLATISYTMLHTTSLAFNDQVTAALALRHLKAYTTLVMEINQIIPHVVLADLRDNGAVINESVLQQAITNTQEVWQRPDGGMQPNGTGISHRGSTAASRKPRTSTSKRAGSESTTASRKPRTTASKPLSGESAATTSKPRTASSKTASMENATATSKPRTTSSKRAPAAGKGKSSISTS